MPDVLLFSDILKYGARHMPPAVPRRFVVNRLYYNTNFQIIKIKGRAKGEKVVKIMKICYTNREYIV